MADAVAEMLRWFFALVFEDRGSGIDPNG